MLLYSTLYTDLDLKDELLKYHSTHSKFIPFVEPFTVSVLSDCYLYQCEKLYTCICLSTLGSAGLYAGNAGVSSSYWPAYALTREQTKARGHSRVWWGHFSKKPGHLGCVVIFVVLFIFIHYLTVVFINHSRTGTIRILHWWLIIILCTYKYGVHLLFWRTSMHMVGCHVCCSLWIWCWSIRHDHWDIRGHPSALTVSATASSWALEGDWQQYLPKCSYGEVLQFPCISTRKTSKHHWVNFLTCNHLKRLLEKHKCLQASVVCLWPLLLWPSYCSLFLPRLPIVFLLLRVICCHCWQLLMLWPVHTACSAECCSLLRL